MITERLRYYLFLFVAFIRGLFTAFIVSTLVPFVEHGWSAIFPSFAPRAVLMMSALTHSAEEDHLYEAKEKEQKDEGEADRAERIEVMAISEAISVPVRVGMTIAIHHRRDRGDLSAFSGFGNCCGNCGRLCNSTGFPSFESHEAACGDEAKEQYNSDQPKHETITKHFYLQ